MIAVGDHYLGQTPEVLLRASCPFGGGLGGGREELCGVLSGGALILGALWGRTTPAENDEALRALARRFRAWFLGRYGSAQCNAIRSQLPEMDKRCAPVVEEGARALVEMMEAMRGQRDCSASLR